MSSTRPVSRPTSHTSRPQRYDLPELAIYTRDTDSRQAVTGYLPKDDGLQKALDGADIVVIPAGIPRQ